MTIRHTLYLLAMMVLAVASAAAQTVQVQAPGRVAAGENFALRYTVSTEDVDEFRAGHIPEGLEVVAGPYESRFSNYRIVNGHSSSSSSVTYTYTVYAAKQGTYTIPAAHATVGGKRVASATAKVIVSGQARQTGGAVRHHQDYDDAGEPQLRDHGAITSADLFIRATASKQRVREQEPVLLTYKVYTNVRLTNLDYKMPDLKGVHTQEVKLAQPRQPKTEVINGRTYQVFTWSQYVLYPQQTGALTIPSITFNGLVMQRRAVDPLEAFFNGGSDYVEVRRAIEAPGLTIHVDPLPQRPAGFSGGVGKLNLSAQLSKQETPAGEPVTLRVVVGGQGNLKLVKQPQVVWPKDFDKYDAKPTDKTRLTTQGVEGNMVWDFLAVPRHQGKFTIPAVELIYFDTQASAYRTLKTQPFTLTVTPGKANGSEGADYSAKRERDIRGLHLGAVSQKADGKQFFGSKSYWGAIVCLLLTFASLLYTFRRRAMQMADLVTRRANRANRVATKRLRSARKLMDGGKKDAFYDEVMRALYGYVGDKMNISPERLSRDNISEQLSLHGASDTAITRLVEAIDECELARYAPGDPAGNMSRTFDKAMTGIMEVEDNLK